MTSQFTEPEPDPRVGEIIDGRYRLVQHLATGGMASVYRAEHIVNGSVVAIKVLHEALSESDEVAARFRREALAARSIRHPNVVSVWDVGRLPDGCCFMVLEFIPGEDLCVRLYREKPFSQVRAVKIALQVAQALVSAHAAGIVHRDLKPDNIMLIPREGDPDFVKVVDFGIAKVKAKGAPMLTAIGSVFGTPEYMAPEQARGASVDHRTDLYTVGTVLYEMLTVRTPFAADNFAEVLMGQMSHPPPPLPKHLDRDLAALVMKLLSKEPADRVQSATELCGSLVAILDRLAPSHPVHRPSPSLPVAPVSVRPLPRPLADLPERQTVGVSSAPPPRPAGSADARSARTAVRPAAVAPMGLSNAAVARPVSLPHSPVSSSTRAFSLPSGSPVVACPTETPQRLANGKKGVVALGWALLFALLAAVTYLVVRLVTAT